MYRTRGFRVDLTRAQKRRVSELRLAQRHAYNWAIELLKADPTLTFFDLQKKLLKARKSHKRLRDVPAEYQKTAIKQARTACESQTSTATAIWRGAPARRASGRRSSATKRQGMSAITPRVCRASAT